MNVVLSLHELESNDPRAAAGRRERRFLCPLCGDDKPRDPAHRSLAVNTQTGAWLCHRCGEKGLLKDYWTERAPQTARPRERSRAVLERAFGLPQAREREPGGEGRFDWRAAWGDASEIQATLGAGYVERRGIPARFAAENGVRFARCWYGRPALLFPVRDESGGLVAVSGRFVDGRENPKTQTAGPKSLGVFATAGALAAPVVAVAEGQMDALALALCGVPSLALIGTSPPEWLPAALAFRPVLVATDADRGGDEAAEKLLSRLSALGARALRLRPRGGKDWNDALAGRGLKALRSALAGFAADADDEVRGSEALRLWRAGRVEAARFVESLITSPAAKCDALEARLGAAETAR
jgi:predicted RNA-binding Zn-ribbon protein involved in translation (DUF1610 family)